MSVQLPNWLLPAGVMLLSVGLVAYKIQGGEMNVFSFVLGGVVGIAALLVATYVIVAARTGQPAP